MLTIKEQIDLDINNKIVEELFNVRNRLKLRAIDIFPEVTNLMIEFPFYHENKINELKNKKENLIEKIEQFNPNRNKLSSDSLSKLSSLEISLRETDAKIKNQNLIIVTNKEFTWPLRHNVSYIITSKVEDTFILKASDVIIVTNSSDYTGSLYLGVGILNGYKINKLIIENLKQNEK